MKAIILGVSTAIVAVTTLAAPAGATFGNSSGYIGGNAGMSSSGYSRIGIKDGKIIFEGMSVTCTKGNFAMGGMFTHNQNVNQSTPTLPSADTSNCNPDEAANNPPANSTVTISGFCDDDAAKLKANVNGTNVTVIVNSTGACKDDDKTPGDIHVITTPPAADNNTPVVKAASAVTTDPKGGATPVNSLPQTGSNEVIAAVVASILAGATYGGVMIIRAIRARG